jgi:hypothetical protein
MTEDRRPFPWVEVLFLLLLGFAAAAFYTRMCAYVRWRQDQPTGHLSLLSWIWSFAALGPFLFLIRVAPNPELSERASREDRRGQILMFLAIGIMFCLEIFLLTF